MKLKKCLCKALSLLLALLTVLQCAPVSVFAVTEDNLCEHHPEHTEDCGDNECLFVCDVCAATEDSEYLDEVTVVFEEAAEEEAELTEEVVEIVEVIEPEEEVIEPEEEVIEPEEEVTEPEEEETEAAWETEPAQGAAEGADSEELEVVTLKVSGETIIDCECELPDIEDILYYDTVSVNDSERSVRESASYGVIARKGLNTAEKGLYDALKKKIKSVASKGGSTVFSLSDVSGLKTTWTSSQLKYSSSNSTSFNRLQNAFMKQFSLSDLHKALLTDCPFDLYWYDKTIGVSYDFSMRLYKRGSTVVKGKVYGLTFTFNVSEDYRSSYYNKTKVTSNVSNITYAKNVAASVVAANKGKSDYEKMVAYKEYICNATDYNDYAADSNQVAYGDPWQLIHVFDNNSSTKVVCEGYSKAFQYLCDLSDLTCITASGGDHMWNVVTLEKKKYLVDVTNCDYGTIGYPDKLFLVGTSYSKSLGGYIFDCGSYNMSFTCSNLGLATSNYVPQHSTPSLTAASNKQTGGGTLSWNSVDRTAIYNVYRAKSAKGKYSLIGTTGYTSFDVSVPAGKTYYYKVKAITTTDSFRNSSSSKAVKVTGKCAQAQVTGTPHTTSGKPVLKWSKISGAAKYEIFRATSYSGSYSKLKTTTSVSYTDTSAKVGVTYYYKVRAIASKSSYNGIFSSIMSCTAICARPTVTVKTAASTGKPVVSWNAVSGAEYYTIWRSKDGRAYEQVYYRYTDTRFVDNAAETDSEYSYKVKAIGAYSSLNSAESKVQTIVATCGRPDVSIGLKGKKPMVSWETVDGATKYYVYRSTNKSSGFKKVATVTSETYTDKKAMSGITYYYKVIAVTDCGNTSAASAVVKMKSK